MRFFNAATIIALTIAIFLSIVTPINIPTAIRQYETSLIKRQIEQRRADEVSAFLARGAEMDKVKKTLWPYTIFEDPPEKIIKPVFTCSGDVHLDVLPCIPTADQVFENQNVGSPFDVPSAIGEPLNEDHDLFTFNVVSPKLAPLQIPFGTLVSAFASLQMESFPRSLIAQAIGRYSPAHSASSLSASLLPGEIKGQFTQQLESGVRGISEVPATKTVVPPPVASFAAPSSTFPTVTLPSLPIATSTTLVDSGSSASEKPTESSKIKPKMTRAEKIEFWQLFIPYMSMGIYIISRGP